MVRLAACLLACGLAIAGCAGLKPELAAAPVSIDASSAAAHVTAYRAARGLGPVRLNSALMQAASRQALAMARRGRMSHNVAGALPGRLSAAGYPFGAAAENIGAGYRTLEAAMAGWKASSGHRKNLLNGRVTEIGIAAAHAPQSRYGTYWALILAAPPERRRGGW